MKKHNQKIAQDAVEIEEFHNKARLTMKAKNRMSTYDEHEVMDTRVSARMKPPRRSLSLGEVDQDEVSSDSGNTSHGRGNYDATASCSSERRPPLHANKLQQQEPYGDFGTWVAEDMLQKDRMLIANPHTKREMKCKFMGQTKFGMFAN